MKKREKKRQRIKNIKNDRVEGGKRERRIQ
jgi:hypothetical protein